MKLAEKYGKTPAQVILRWHVQMGTSVIPDSKSPTHIAGNASIFDFDLTADEMAESAAGRVACGARLYRAAGCCRACRLSRLAAMVQAMMTQASTRKRAKAI